MKKILFGLTLAAGLTLTSCSSFLEEPILGQQDMKNYFATEDECANQVVGCYAYLACDDWWQIYKHYGLVDMCTDDEWMGNTTQEPGDYLPPPSRVVTPFRTSISIVGRVSYSVI